MAGRLKKYGFINAKLRARISNILKDEFMEKLSRSHSLPEAVQLFKDTSYTEIESVYSKTGDLKMVELELLSSTVNHFIEIERYLSEEVEDFIKTLAMRYEVDNLKNLIRLWFDKVIRKRDIYNASLYLYRKRIHFDLHIDEVLAAETLEQIALMLKGTPYSDIIAKSIPKVMEKQSLFPLEIALDRFYYRDLLDHVEKLSKQDSEIARRLIGVEIDMQNINLIVRFKTMYHLPLEEALGYIFPFGYTVGKEAISRIYESNEVSGILEGLIRRKYSGLKILLASPGTDTYSRLILIERILDQIMLYEVQRILYGYPFSIGIILAYFILKRNEVRKIMTILNAKYYNIDADKIKGKL